MRSGAGAQHNGKERAYSLKCREVKFSEVGLPLYVVLRSSGQDCHPNV